MNPLLSVSGVAKPGATEWVGVGPWERNERREGSEGTRNRDEPWWDSGNRDERRFEIDGSVAGQFDGLGAAERRGSWVPSEVNDATDRTRPLEALKASFFSRI